MSFDYEERAMHFAIAMFGVLSTAVIIAFAIGIYLRCNDWRDYLSNKNKVLPSHKK